MYSRDDLGPRRRNHVSCEKEEIRERVGEEVMSVDCCTSSRQSNVRRERAALGSQPQLRLRPKHCQATASEAASQMTTTN
jgi:hypothetical protein